MSEYTREQLIEWCKHCRNADFATKATQERLDAIVEHLDTKDAQPASAPTLYERVTELMALAKKKGKVLEWPSGFHIYTEQSDLLITGWLATWLHEQGKSVSNLNMWNQWFVTGCNDSLEAASLLDALIAATKHILEQET